MHVRRTEYILKNKIKITACHNTKRQGLVIKQRHRRLKKIIDN